MKGKMFRVALYLGVTFASGLLLGQQRPAQLGPAVQRQVQDVSVEQQGSKYIHSWTIGSETHTGETDAAEQVEVIVEFVDSPLLLQPQDPTAPRRSRSFGQRVSQFSADLSVIDAQLSSRYPRFRFPQSNAERSFYKIFSGVSVKVPRMALAEIRRLSYVKKIHPNHKIELHLGESVPLIGADRVWEELGTRGEGVVIAIIDTGIDYMHPALGGGFGPEFKVIGGYDFANDDPDPMDDNNHGTHVAGIAAANGENLKGVAPEAKLMAYKAFSATGESRESNIIAAIERAVDPNNDGDFSDRVDVMNMSFGSDDGGPDDAKSTAVDNAVRAGITICISSGNRGEFNSIGSPGTARLAITVSASDKSDRMASFSSAGPNKKIFSIKPEVVAPGVSVVSSVRNGGYESFQGTSMAAPHVAGVCALLKALHPNWTPAQIKSALMTTAIDLGEEVMVQGAGRIDAFGATQVRAFATPAHLSFGFADDSQAEWVTSQTVTLINERTHSQIFRVGFGGIRHGVQLSAEPSNFNLTSGQSIEITITLTVNTNAVANRSSGTSLSYDGTLSFLGTVDTLRLPWAFAKALKMRLAFDEPDPFFLVTGENYAQDVFDAARIDPFAYDLLLPETGPYEIFTFFNAPGYEPPELVFRQDVGVLSSTTLDIQTSDARHLIDFDGVDEEGKLLSSLSAESGRYTTRYVWMYPLNGRVSILMESDSLYTTPLPAEFNVFATEAYHDLGNSDRIFLLQHEPISGVSGDLTLKSESADWISQNLNITLPPYAGNPHLGFLVSFVGRDGHLNGNVGGRIPVPTRHWNGKLFVGPDVRDDFGFTPTIRALVDTMRLDIQDAYIFTEHFRVVDRRFGSFETPTPSPDIYLASDNGTMHFGEAPIYPDMQYEVSSNKIRVSVDFRGSLNEQRYYDPVLTDFELYNAEDQTIASGNVLDPAASQCGIHANCIDIGVLPGSYRLEFANRAYFAGPQPGQGRLNSRFDTRLSDRTPPMLTSLKLLNTDGVPVPNLIAGEAGTLMFSAADDRFLAEDGSGLQYQPIDEDATRLYFKSSLSEQWITGELVKVLEDAEPIDVSGHHPIGFLYHAELPGLVEILSGPVDLKICIADKSGNSTEWILEPAFTIGVLTVGVDEEPKNDPSVSIPTQYRLYNNYPNPFNPATTIRYDLPEATRVALKIYNVIGQEVRVLVDEFQAAGVKSQVWDGRDNAGSSVSSGVYFYSIQTPAFRSSLKLIVLK